jgi:hypothetical protein
VGNKQEAIAEKFGIQRQTITDIINKIAENGNIAKIGKDFQPYLYNIWKNEITEKNVRHGLTFRESKPHVFITDFSATAWRQAYVKALFLENEKWTKCIESQENGRIINAIVDCKEKHRTDRNLDLQAELKDIVYNNLEYRQGYYEAFRDGKPTTKFKKYLHPDVRRFIQKYVRYKNATEVLHSKDRKLSDRGIFNGAVQHEQRANRRIKKPKKFAIRQAQSKEKSILRKRPCKVVA